MNQRFEVIVIGGGHAGVEAAWAAANALGRPRSVALVTLDPATIGVMSCNPAIGGLAKGQLVREVDALGGLMGLATDATGIQFRVLNTSKGAAVHGPRAQCDKHAYAEQVRRLIASREEIVVVGGSVERMVVEGGRVVGVEVVQHTAHSTHHTKRQGGDKFGCVLCDVCCVLSAPAVVLTTGTFMRGLMHTGESQTPGGRFGEGAATGISGALREMGFELGRLKTGTPPRLRRSTIDWESLEEQRGDEQPVPFSDLSMGAVVDRLRSATSSCANESNRGGGEDASTTAPRFPALPQVDCRITATNAAIHDLIRANLHRAPMYSGQIQSVGPRYCPSIEDKVVRFAERTGHHVYLEPESLRPDHAEWIYCNGISTSLPADVQERIVRSMPGCERAQILRHGYAVEYDMVRPHQIAATGMTKLVEGLFLAGQINGTSGYEEAAAQGLVAGINAARHATGRDPVTIGRDEAYIGVLMDDLVTKTPAEPYRMFTSRAEHRLTLRADNAADRLTPLAQRLGLLATTDLERQRWALFERRRDEIERIKRAMSERRVDGKSLAEHVRRPEFTPTDLHAALGESDGFTPAAVFTAHTDGFYDAYARQTAGRHARVAEMDRKRIPTDFDYAAAVSLRSESKAALMRFRPETLGQAGRLEAITPADLTLLSVLIARHREKAMVTR